MLISKPMEVRPHSAANSQPTPKNSAAGLFDRIVSKLLILLYSWVHEARFSGVATRFLPAGREMRRSSRWAGSRLGLLRRQSKLSASLAKHPALRRQAEEDLADGLEMDRAALALLGAGMDVAQAALERVFVKDRIRAGGTVDGRDDLAGLVDRPGRREAQPRMLLGAELAGAFGLFPHLGQGLVDQGAGRAQFRLALRHLRLDHVVLAQSAAGTAGDLVAGQHDKRVERAAGDAERNVGEARGVNHAAGEAVEQTGLAPLGLVVARGGVFLRHEKVVEAIAVAAGAAQPDDLPIVDDLGAGLRKQYGTDERAAVRVEPRGAVRLEDRDMRAEPGGVPAAGGEAPAPGDADAAFDGHTAPRARQFRSPGEDAARWPEDLARHRWVEIGGGHRAARILPQTPGGRGVGLGDLLEHLDIGQRIKLGAAQRTRQQHAEKAALDQRLDNPLRKLAPLLDLVRGGCQHRRDFARPYQVIDGRVGAAQIERGRRHHVLRLGALLSLRLKLHRMELSGRRFPRSRSDRAPPAPGQEQGQKALDPGRRDRPWRADQAGKPAEMKEADHADSNTNRKDAIDAAAHFGRCGEIDEGRLHD